MLLGHRYESGENGGTATGSLGNGNGGQEAKQQTGNKTVPNGHKILLLGIWFEK